MSEINDLPSVLVRHLIEAWRQNDPDRVQRIIRKAERGGDELVPELTATYKLAATLPEEQAAAARGAVRLIGVATRSIGGMAFILRELARTSPNDSAAIVQVVEKDAPLWIETALALMPVAREEEDAELRLVCATVLGMAEPGTAGVEEMLAEERSDVA